MTEVALQNMLVLTCEKLTKTPHMTGLGWKMQEKDTTKTIKGTHVIYPEKRSP